MKLGKIGGRTGQGIFGRTKPVNTPLRQSKSDGASGVFSAGTAYAPTSTGSTYGGPPGAFISRRQGTAAPCPSGYSQVKMSRGDYRCVPKPQPIIQAPPPPSPPAPIITVSPSFQQQFTPQFSPTMQQQQDSPGATQTAVPTQTTDADQTVPTTPAPLPPQITVPPQAPLPSPAPLPYPAQLPPIIGPRITEPETDREKGPTYNTQTTDNINWLPIVAIGGILLFAMTQPKEVKKS